MSSITPERPKKKSAPTKYVILRLVDVDGAQLWENCATGEGDPKAIIRVYIEQNDGRRDELLNSHYQAIPASSWKTGDDLLTPKPRIVF